LGWRVFQKSYSPYKPMSILQHIKDIFAPKKCYSCKKEGHFFCPECCQQIEKFRPYCYICKKPSENFMVHEECSLASNLDQVLIFWKYTSKYIKKLVHDGKYYGKKEIYEDLSWPMVEFFQQHHYIEKQEDYVVIATPMHFLRSWKRGYNHSHILAKSIAQHLQIDYHMDIVKKKKLTKQQSHLRRSHRLVNLKNAFAVNKNYKQYLQGKTVILVDDVISTWSTLGEISGLLKLFGIKSVVWLVIASD